MRIIALIILLIISTAALSGCATTQANRADVDLSDYAPLPEVDGKPSIEGFTIEKPEFTVAEFAFDTSSGLTVPKEELQAMLADFDVPITMTDRVQYYVKFFTSNARRSMQAWIDRSNEYMYIVRDI
ncbi:MAG: hypothetical protein LBV04_02845, partial [Deferribacteraceae bacterium]|nr:hypothetical protein [Deferribacteraceae bacterium]